MRVHRTVPTRMWELRSTACDGDCHVHAYAYARACTCSCLVAALFFQKYQSALLPKLRKNATRTAAAAGGRRQRAPGRLDFSRRGLRSLKLSLKLFVKLAYDP